MAGRDHQQGFATAEAICDHFSEQADWCERLGSPFTASLIRQFRRDFEAGGVVRALVADRTGFPRADALALRLAGVLHYAALSGRSEDLARLYPSQTRSANVETLWPVASDFLEREESWARAFLQHPPQTNETRRAIMMLIGLSHIEQIFSMPIRLLELGASAGLNQNFDAFHVDAGCWQWGDVDAAVQIESKWKGPAPKLSRKFNIIERRGCDQHPLDLTDEETRLRLKSYIWADQPERLARFDAATQLALQRQTQIEKADAADWLKARLEHPPEGVATMIFHSVFFQYPPHDTRTQLKNMIEDAGGRATQSAPVIWLRYEPEVLWDRSADAKIALNMVCDARIWPSDQHIRFARSDGHVRVVESLMA